MASSSLRTRRSDRGPRQGLIHPPPAQVARQTQHRRKGPVDAGGHTSSAVTRATAQQLGIPAANITSWVGKMVAPFRRSAVNGILTDQQRYPGRFCAAGTSPGGSFRPECRMERLPRLIKDRSSGWALSIINWPTFLQRHATERPPPQHSASDRGRAGSSGLRLGQA